MSLDVMVLRGDVLGRRVDARPDVRMVRPVRRPNIKGLAPQQQVERQVHLLSQGRAKHRVGIGRDPPAIGEAAAGIFVWPAWGLDDAIEGDMFKHHYFSHD